MDYNPEELRGLFKYTDRVVQPYWVQHDIGASCRFSFMNDYPTKSVLKKGSLVEGWSKSFELPLEFLEVV